MAALPVNSPGAAPPRWTAELLGRLEQGPLAGAGHLERAGGRFVARHRRGIIASAFQPVVSTRDGSVFGHQAYARAAGHGGEAAAPWSVFAHAADGQEVVRLDRLVRTTHALNYFDRPRAQPRLFVRVEQRLLDTVTDEYGRAFEEILDALGARPAQVVIVLPSSAIDDPTVFVRATLSYRRRGYAVAAQARSVRDLARSSIALAEPGFVILPRPSADQIEAAGRVTGLLHGLGVRTIARDVETAGEAAWSHAAGFDLLQGHHFGKPLPDAWGGRP